MLHAHKGSGESECREREGCKGGQGCDIFEIVALFFIGCIFRLALLSLFGPIFPVINSLLFLLFQFANLTLKLGLVRL